MAKAPTPTIDLYNGTTANSGKRFIAGVAFAFRFGNEDGFVQQFFARQRDLVARALYSVARCMLVFKDVGKNPVYSSRWAVEAQRDFYDFSWENKERISRFVRENRIALVVFQGADPGIDLKFLRKLGLRTIATEDDSFDHRRGQSFVRGTAKFLLRSVLKHNVHDLHIANTRGQYDFLRKYAHFPRDRLWTVPYGVDPEFYHPADRKMACSQLGLDPDTIWIMAAAQSRPEKRVDLLIHAIKRVKEARPLTGRENIYLNGAVLGMRRAEIRKKFDEIVAFAEVERFLDTPVKRYSSGMYVRLAFAVAAHLEPEILVIDEVLAVGDAEFQKKCLGKMNDVSRREGRTVLFVTHNMGIVTSLCPNAIWLDRGTICERGPAREVIEHYMSTGMSDLERVVRLKDLPRPYGRLRILSLEWVSELPLRHGEPMRARICFETRSQISAVSIGIGFSTVDGTRLLTYETDFQDGHRSDFSGPGTFSVEVTVDELPLGPDIYNVDVGSRSGDFHGLDYLPACQQVEVTAGPKTPGYIVRKGAAVRLPSDWTWETAQIVEQKRDLLNKI